MTSIESKIAPVPKDHFGFQPGEDRKLADWPDMVAYFRALDEASDRVRAHEIGKTTEGNPFLLVTISSPENLANLERWQGIQAKLADPRAIRDDTEAEGLIAEGRAVVAVTCSIHATEVGAAQMSPLLAYHLASSDDERVRNILDNVVLLLVPSLNPDGLIMVKRWYDRTLGTKHEGVNPPYLYHRYTGHDNNRDWFMFTQAETRLTVERCINAWRPQVLFDLHQTRANGMRMILPPFVDPPGPNVDPVLQSEIAMLGAAIASEMTAQGKAGVAMNVVYDAYSPSRTYTHYHGGVRILSEAASAKIATPVVLEESDLRTARGENPTRRSWSHPMPWKGGRWGLP
ncbi:MAG: M14 family metallopeptidase, partial [Chloroflexi bacterium]|nr:M14 family metallopeptidase [Chloroflexota bacterium]